MVAQNNQCRVHVEHQITLVTSPKMCLDFEATTVTLQFLRHNMACVARGNNQHRLKEMVQHAKLSLEQSLNSKTIQIG